MEGNGRILSWIAVGISALALVIALGGRSQPVVLYAPPGIAQQAPDQRAGPMRPHAGPDMRWDAPGHPEAPRFWQEHHSFHWKAGHGAWWMRPFGIFGGLIQLALLVLLVLAVLKWLKRRRGPGGPPRHEHRETDPESPPYTGSTQNL